LTGNHLAAEFRIERVRFETGWCSVHASALLPQL
jgi:hypothetical protein